MQNVIRTLRSNGIRNTAGGSLLMLAANAHAALPAGIATGLTSIETDILALVDLLWPVVIAVVFGYALFKFFKRGVKAI